jgi:hypothetical protein
MGKIVSNFFIALDGVVEAPNEWHFPYFDDAMGRVVSEGMQTQSALSVEGPPVNRVYPSGPRQLRFLPARSRGQGGAPHWTNDLDRGEDRHTMTAAGGRVCVVGR